MKFDLFTYSDWFNNDIYVSANGNVYCLYIFDGIKCLIMDADMTFDELKDIDNFDRTTSEVMVYWMYVDNYLIGERFMQSVRDIIEEYEENSEEFFKKYNSKGRN